jgi:hypothetical protein
VARFSSWFNRWTEEEEAVEGVAGVKSDERKISTMQWTCYEDTQK